MIEQAFAQPSDGKPNQQAAIPSPTVFLVDCGCWQGHYQTFGVASGSHIVVGTFGSDGVAITRDMANEKILALFGRLPGAKVATAASRSGASTRPLFAHLAPVSVEEQSKPDAILCAPADLFLFVPDTHLGLRDLADDFARFQTTNLENLAGLVALLEAARSEGATIIQTGDLFDLWEVEADTQRNIYYEEVGGQYRYRDGKARAKRAAEAIADAWRQADSKTNFNRLLKLIDHYLPGNHDIEVQWSDNMVLRSKYLNAPRSPSANLWAGGEKFIYRSVHTDQRVAWEAEHGHQHDPNNRTQGCHSEDEILAGVAGERITFLWARKQRKQLLHTKTVHTTVFPIVESIRHPDDNTRGFSEHLLEPSLSVLSGNDSNGNERYVYTLGVELGSFNYMRESLAQSIVMRTANLNRELDFFYWYEFGWPWDERSNFRRTAFWVARDGAATKPLNLPVRAVFHSHTHTALIRELEFRRATNQLIKYERSFVGAKIRQCPAGGEPGAK